MPSEISLVKSKRLKFPQAKNTVQSTMRRAIVDAAKYESGHAIVVLVDDGGISVNNSRMSKYEAIGILERAKYILMENS